MGWPGLFAWWSTCGRRARSAAAPDACCAVPRGGPHEGGRAGGSSGFRWWSRNLDNCRGRCVRMSGHGGELGGAMGIEVRESTEAETFADRPMAASRGFLGLAGRRRVVVGGIAEVRGSGGFVCGGMRCFRRLLLVADVVAIVGAFVLTVEFSRRSLGLTWAAAAGVPILVVCAKLTGLYDRDETLLRKTTLDEAPKLFQLATLCALVAWLTGGLITHRPLDRHEALFLWLALAGGLLLARAVSRALALRMAPAERCLFIGDEISAETIRSKLSGHGGVKAEVVAHLDLDKVGVVVDG